ncbi:aminotransferase class I/II-fold pyridoxal phosphate-dependent enzyme [Dongia sedimenti]|uniref:Aminotransferase class I/II-fold pyridoxal phosphate-dependent enzyme n=1 Tax=Dongia sedimenti TaxID=3064282 RepID=A0ABU0YKX8_9PROT|nr:aminotransferase class I/II-fold pyridoxal phosphate-dependent enzyme [Rhodospirillaceae bacterium R-7]
MTMLPDFKLETYLAKWEFAARYHMTASDMESMTVAELLALAEPEDRQAFDTMRLAYIEAAGTPALRAAIAGTYAGLAPEDVLAFAGAEEGIFCAMHALLDKDSHAVVVTPNYQSSETLPLSICATSGVALRESENWALDIDELHVALRPYTKLVLINFPHNPTGKVIDRATFDAVVKLCRERGIYLFSDEVYRGLERRPELQLPQAADVYERGLSLNVMSKAYGLPGLRVGWIACRDRALLARMERLKHYLSICNASPSEHLAVIALKARERILARNLALIDANLAGVNAFFDEFADLFDWQVPDGGCIGFPRYKGKDGVESFCKRLAEEIGVVLLPASIYQSALTPTPTERFRIGFGRSYVPEGLAAMRAWLRGNRQAA